MNVFRPRALAALFAAATLISCGDGIAPVPEPELEQALDQLSDAEALASPGVTMMGGISSGPATGGAAACLFNSSNKRFECPQVTLNGLTIARYFQLLDATGAPQSAWGENVVAIRNVSDVSGTPPGGPGAPSVQMTSHDESTLSGLRADTKTLTGTGTSTFTFSGQTPLVMNMTRTTNLTLPPQPGPNSYPTGTISMTMAIQGAPTTPSTMTMTYNGTSTVTMTSTTGSLTQTCTMNLASPQTPPVCS